MRQSLLNRIFGTIFAAGLAFVVLLSLYSTLPASATESVSQIIYGTDNDGVSAPSILEGQKPLRPGKKYPLTFIPALGLGTWQSKPNEVASAVKSALDIGYRHIDGAAAYGNEKEVGKGIELSGVPRNEIWLTSKLVNQKHHPDLVEPAIRKTLSDLGVEYLDLYLMHWPIAIDDGKLAPQVNFVDTWHAMEKLVEKGFTKNIGISNFAQHQVEELLKASKIRPAAHEFETHPYLQQSDFVAWNIRHGIQVIAYSPFANLNPVYDARLPSILDDPAWITLAKVKNATIPQTILAWGMQRGTIVIPKSTHPNRIAENWDSKNLAITFSEAELVAVKLTDKKVRFNNPFPNAGLFDDLDDPTAGKGKKQDL